ncbi:MAG: heterodisulfide reductase-related iron-sulfur binding cluster [Pseudanabaenaceae cyanobacterium bins.68]|nr:heterodisulfide reductase-related iron-sulfur binding cluster [Pseudanabaenaceae cyanobacterium bins.68]
MPDSFVHPPAADLLKACIHCGFCLSTCPSYRVIGKETDSPRGRIYLMDRISQGEIGLNATTAAHFDTCLGCLACVTTCPSGVAYDQLISAVRPEVERIEARSGFEQILRQLIFRIFPYRDRLRWLLAPLWLYQGLGIQALVRRSGWLPKLLPAQLVAMEQILPRISAASFSDRLPQVFPAQGQQRYRVGMIVGCVQPVFLPEINQATVRVLAANGCEVVIPPGQSCCAALSHHQGQTAQAQALARQMIDRFSAYDLDFIVINASGCGHTLKEYGHILADDPEYAQVAQQFAAKIKDVQEFLDLVGLTAPLHAISDRPLKLAYQDACHMLHGQKISLQPRRLLRQIPQVELREPSDAALCCGSAGIYNLLQPQVGAELGRQKAENLVNTGADLIASANVGCTLQIRQHLQLQSQSLPIYHPMELLDLAIRGEKLSMIS